MPIESLPPAELLVRYDNAAHDLALAPPDNRARELAAWEALRTVMLGRLTLAWHEDASGQ
jgi:hypothetical protein